MKLKTSKKAVSLMVSYVLLITIAISLSIGVYAWLKYIANVSAPADCKEGTSIIIENYDCSTNIPNFKVRIKNNGLFSIDGIILTVSDNPDREPIKYLTPFIGGEGSTQGIYVFKSSLKPGEIGIAEFINKDASGNTISNVKVIRIQPFIKHKNKRILCSESVIKETIQECTIG